MVLLKLGLVVWVHYLPNWFLTQISLKTMTWLEKRVLFVQHFLGILMKMQWGRWRWLVNYSYSKILRVFAIVWLNYLNDFTYFFFRDKAVVSRLRIWEIGLGHLPIWLLKIGKCNLFVDQIVIHLFFTARITFGSKIADFVVICCKCKGVWRLQVVVGRRI